MRFWTVRRRVPLLFSSGLTLAALAVVSGSVLGQPAIATADTARIVTDDATRATGPSHATIVVTAVDGTTRTLGPYRFRHVPTELTSSPDGRYLAVRFGTVSQSREIPIVPTDGSESFVLRATPRSLVPSSISDFSWSADGSELIVGNADDQRAPRGRWRYHSAALRCPIVTRVCQRIPGSEGLAAAVPGGIVTTTPLDDVLPSGSQLGGDIQPTTIDARPARQSRYERELLREVRKRERARTTLIRTNANPPTTTVLAAQVSRLTTGADAAVHMLGGPSGALIVHDRQRVTVKRRGTKLRLRTQTQGRRWTVVGPDGKRRTRRAPELQIPKTDGASDGWGGPVRGQRALAVPRVPVATGGWLGSVGRTVSMGPDGLALTIIDASGATRFARAGGRIASADALVRTVAGRTPTPGVSSLDVIGYEATTSAAVVALAWGEGPPPKVDRLPDGSIDPEGVTEVPADEDNGPHHATVRVPLDGRTSPTVITREHEHAAW